MLYIQPLIVDHSTCLFSVNLLHCSNSVLLPAIFNKNVLTIDKNWKTVFRRDNPLNSNYNFALFCKQLLYRLSFHIEIMPYRL